MVNSEHLTKLDHHFAFGENWARYSQKIGDKEIEEATESLDRLVGGSLPGKTFLDLGCGSGLHSLAALRLGAIEVVSVDIDPDSITTTSVLLEKYAKDRKYRVVTASVFDMSPDDWGQFDVVYSWGVLHHTGDMFRAIRGAAALVKPGGQFVFALYRRTWMCWLWKREKAWYAKTSSRAQDVARSLYVRLFSAALLLRGKTLRSHVQGYRTRGMDFYHDVHDWLGGYPYDSISPPEVARLMYDMDFVEIYNGSMKGRILGRYSGIFGSGCDEYTYARSEDTRSPRECASSS